MSELDPCTVLMPVYVEDPEPIRFAFQCSRCDFGHVFDRQQDADEFTHEHIRQHAEEDAAK